VVDEEEAGMDAGLGEELEEFLALPADLRRHRGGRKRKR
jgi:hypothetical protein